MRDWEYVHGYAAAKTGVIQEIRACAGDPDFACALCQEVRLPGFR